VVGIHRVLGQGKARTPVSWKILEFSDSENASQFLLGKYVIFNSFSDPKELFK